MTRTLCEPYASCEYQIRWASPRVFTLSPSPHRDPSCLPSQAAV